MRLEFVLAGLGIAAFVWLKKQADQAGHDQARSRETYRPGSARGGGVRFNDANQGDQAGRDAFTGEDLDPARQIFQCLGCRVWYHGDTVKSLGENNSGKCVACNSTDIVRDQVTEDTVRRSRT